MSFGTPIMSLNDGFNLIKVIGIHKETNFSEKINRGIFIKKIIEIGLIYHHPCLDFSTVNLFFCFMSGDSNINYGVTCGRSDTFFRVEEKLYCDYPELRYKNLKFLHNGKVINRFSSLIDNNICNYDRIMIMEYE